MATMENNRLNNNRKDQPKAIYIGSELYALIMELMTPRIKLIHKILAITTINSGDLNNDGGDPSLPYLTGENGYLELTESALHGMDAELISIGMKYKEYILDYFKKHDDIHEKKQCLDVYMNLQKLIEDLSATGASCLQYSRNKVIERVEYVVLAKQSTEDSDARKRLELFDYTSYKKIQRFMVMYMKNMKEFVGLFDQPDNEQEDITEVSQEQQEQEQEQQHQEEQEQEQQHQEEQEKQEQEEPENM